MPVLNISEDERTHIVAALHHERVRLAREWQKGFDDSESMAPIRDQAMEALANALDEVTDLRRKIEVAVDITKAAWHNEFGWLHPKKFVEAAKDAVEAGEITREEVAAAYMVDLSEVDAENVRDRMRQDQMSPGTWTTLPDGYEVDADPFEITDPEEKIVIASADTQTDGTMIGVQTFPTEADKSVNNAIWALITRNFSAVSHRDIELAEKVLRDSPEFLNAIKSSVEDLRKEYGVLAPEISGWTTIPDGFEIAHAEPTTFPYWNDMEGQSDGLIQGIGQRSAGSDTPSRDSN